MKIIQNVLIIVLSSVLLIACNGESNKKIEEQNNSSKEIVENLKNVEVQIKGMTCEIGCARLIQSKLYKTGGVKFAKVSFEDSLGMITYDLNRVSESKIKDVIQKAGGGDLYTVVDIKEVQEFSKAQ